MIWSPFLSLASDFGCCSPVEPVLSAWVTHPSSTIRHPWSALPFSCPYSTVSHPPPTPLEQPPLILQAVVAAPFMDFIYSNSTYSPNQPLPRTLLSASLYLTGEQKLLPSENDSVTLVSRPKPGTVCVCSVDTGPSKERDERLNG